MRKEILKKLLAFTLTLVMVLSVYAPVNVKAADTDWTLADFTIEGTTITGLSESGITKCSVNPDVVMPDVNAAGETITDIGEGTTKGLFAVQGVTFGNVTLPSGLVTIGKYAFAKSGMTGVVMPNTVTTIGNYAFRECKITSADLPSAITALPKLTFYNNSPVVTLYTNNTELLSDGNGYYASSTYHKVVYSSLAGTGWSYEDFTFDGTTITGLSTEGQATLAALKTLVLPDTTSDGSTAVTAIADNAFADADGEGGITSVVLPANIVSIGASAFANNELSSVTLPDSLTTLASDAFAGNYGTNGDGVIVCYVSADSQLQVDSDSMKFETASIDWGSDAVVTVSGTYNYTGAAIIPSVTVTYDGVTLVEGTDYTLEVTNNLNAGTATVVATAKGGYTGTASTTFTIEKVSLGSATIIGLSDVTYTGEAFTPSVMISVAGFSQLTENTDYTVSYANNTNAGTATVTVSGNGNFTGTASSTFVINAASLDDAEISGLSTLTYIGSALAPTVTVKKGDVTLVKDTDYTVSYANNTNVGTATVTVTGKGNYSGSKSANYAIEASTITEGVSVEAISAQTYNGSAIEPSVVVKKGNTTLVKDTDYTVAYENNTNVGTATVTITGKGNYTGSTTVTFEIVAATIEDAEVGQIASAIYNTEAIEPEVSVTKAGATLVLNADYTVAYENNVNAGTATIIITGKGNYTGSKSITFEIVAATIEDVIVADIADAIYNGSTIEPEVSVMKGETSLVNGVDYVVAYDANINVGTATITITGKDNYDGTVTTTFEILPATIADATVADIADVIYSGVAVEPEVSVVIGETVLAYEADYDVAYEANVNAGTATITITGKGNYTDAITKTFVICPLSLENATITGVSAQTYNGTAITPTVSVKMNGVDLVEVTDYTVSYEANDKPGKGCVVISGTGNYSGTAVKEFNITLATTKIAVTNLSTGVNVTWNKVQGATAYVVYRNGKAIATVTTTAYVDKAVSNGAKYIYTVQAKTGEVIGEQSVPVTTYFVKKVKLKKVTNLAGKKVQVKWAKNKKASGYEIRLVTGSKTKVVKATKKNVSKIVKKLKKGKKYTVSIRAYKKVGTVKYYSAWSNVKKVKIKK